jgi:hypothetical protein
LLQQSDYGTFSENARAPINATRAAPTHLHNTFAFLSLEFYAEWRLCLFLLKKEKQSSAASLTVLVCKKSASSVALLTFYILQEMKVRAIKTCFLNLSKLPRIIATT